MKENKIPSQRWIFFRMILVIVLVFGAFGMVGVRAYRLQIEEGSRLLEMAEQQYLKDVDLPSRRGIVYDRHGAELAASVEVDSVYVNPRMIKDKRNYVAQKLSKILGLNKIELMNIFKSKSYFRWVKRRISPQIAKKVDALKIPGVFFANESKRFYPNKVLGAAVIGFAGIDGKGLDGVELSQDGWLRGSRVQIPGLRDALGRPVYSEGFDATPASGHNLFLTLDKFIQYQTEEALKTALLRPNTGWAAAVVMDPKTGDILAMANYPSFDPNNFSKASPQLRRNRAISDEFEPGSIAKVFSVAAALENRAIKPSDTFFAENGKWRVGKHIINDTHGHGVLTVTQCLEKSSNICASKIAFKLGKESLYKTLRKFGFGQSTQIALSGERMGVIWPPNRWSNVGLANISFGQGMTTTLLQITRAFSAIANGGMLMDPRLFIKIQNPAGQTIRTVVPNGVRIIRREVADEIRKMLVYVTGKEGTGKKAAVDHYTVAGKTGTAQKVDSASGKYSDRLWVSSFLGMVPASNPKVVITVVLNEPEGKRYHGGDVAAPIFKEIASKTLRYLGVKPDKEEIKKIDKTPSIPPG